MLEEPIPKSIIPIHTNSPNHAAYLTVQLGTTDPASTIILYGDKIIVQSSLSLFEITWEAGTTEIPPD